MSKREPDRSGMVVKSGNSIARSHEVDALRIVALFGHLRANELARVLFPTARSLASGYEMARRTLSRMAEKGLVVRRLNAVGSTSFVLSPRGAEAAERHWGRGLGLWGDEPQGSPVRDGYDLAPSGAMFRHRTLATAFVASRMGAHRGDLGWGEYAIAKGWSPATQEQLKEHWHGKLPDAILFCPHRPNSVGLLDFVEVEASLKPTSELRRVLEVAWLLNRPITPGSYVRVDRLAIVFDAAERHEQRIIRTIIELARERASQEDRGSQHENEPTNGPPSHVLIERYASVFMRVDLVRATITAPLTIVSFETVTLLDAIRAAYAGVAGLMA